MMKRKQHIQACFNWVNSARDQNIWTHILDVSDDWNKDEIIATAVQSSVNIIISWSEMWKILATFSISDDIYF